MAVFTNDEEDMLLNIPFQGGRLHLSFRPPVSTDSAPDGWSEWYYIGVDEAINSVQEANRHFQDAASNIWSLSIHSVPWADEHESNTSGEEQGQSAHQEDIGAPPSDEGDWTPASSGAPLDSDRYQKDYVWACRGNVSEITEQVQMASNFDQSLTEKYIASLLNSANAAEQLAFLEVYLPGETQSIQRAIARQILYEIHYHDPDVYAGRQRLDVHQFDDGSIDYPEPPLPPNAPRGWSRQDDVMLQTFIGTHPEAFLAEYGRMFYP